MVSLERAREINRLAERCESGTETCEFHQKPVVLAEDVALEDAVHAARRLVTHYLLTPGLRLRMPDGTRDEQAERLMAALIRAVD